MDHPQQQRHQQIHQHEVQQQRQQMPLEAERCVQAHSVLPSYPNSVQAYTRENASHDHELNMEAHRTNHYYSSPAPAHHGERVLNQQQLQRLPMNRRYEIPFGSDTSRELSPAAYAPDREFPVSPTPEQRFDIGNQKMGIQQMGNTVQSSFAAPGYSRIPAASNVGFFTHSYSGVRVPRLLPSQLTMNVNNLAMETMQGESVSGMSSPFVQRSAPLPPPAGGLMSTHKINQRSIPFDSSMRAQNPTLKTVYGEVGALDLSISHEGCNKRAQLSKEAARFSRPAEIAQRANIFANTSMQEKASADEIQVFEPKRQFRQSGLNDRVNERVGAQVQQQRGHNTGAGGRNLEIGLNNPVSKLNQQKGPHYQQPGPSTEAARTNMPPKRALTEYKDLDRPEINDVLNQEGYSSVGTFASVPAQMENSVDINQAAKCGKFETIQENYSDDMLTDLESNYTTSRDQCLSKKSGLMTPKRYLRILCRLMETNLHTESIRLNNSESGRTQYRTEIYAGKFCGVAHSENYELSFQLAAAHVLERMKSHFNLNGFKSVKYALYTGCRFSGVGNKLEELCEQNNLSLSFSSTKNRSEGCRFKIMCAVKSFQIKMEHDHRLFGEFLAKAEVYKHLTKGNPALEMQVEDYFEVGKDCPTRKDLGLEPPFNESILEWMLENKVKDIDCCLHDCMKSNSSSYMGYNGVWSYTEADKYKQKLNNAMNKIKLY